MHFGTHHFCGASTASGKISLQFSTPLNPLAHEHGDLSFRFMWRTLSYKERVVIRDSVKHPEGIDSTLAVKLPALGGRTWKDNDAGRGKGGNRKELIYILRGLFEAAANAGVGYTFADVELFISCRARVRARNSSMLKGATETTVGGVSPGFRDLPIYCDSVDVPENFFSRYEIRDTREKQFFSKNLKDSLVEIELSQLVRSEKAKNYNW